jgi:signal peptidase
MSPTFDAGSVVFVRPLPPEEIRVGDILTYKVRGGDSIVTHRVVEIVEEDGKLGFITRGDANDVNDEGILEPERVIGRVNYYLPYLGRLMTFTQTKQGLLTLVFIPGILIIIYELKNILQYAVAMEKEKQAKAEAAAESSEEQPLP